MSETVGHRVCDGAGSGQLLDRRAAVPGAELYAYLAAGWQHW